MDDASEDGTPEVISREFPQVTVVRSHESKGCIVQRNRAARMASGDIIFSIDDDAEFSTTEIVKQTLQEFVDPSIGAIAIPYTEPKKSDRIFQKAPDTRHVWIASSFIGTAYAIRKTMFCELGGYCDEFVRQGEEPDLAVRMLARGYVIRMGGADVIRHYESPIRDHRQMDFFGSRNLLLFQWRNAPLRVLPFAMLATAAKVLMLSFRPRKFVVRLEGVVRGIRDMTTLARRPVDYQTYRKWRRLRKRGPQMLIR